MNEPIKELARQCRWENYGVNGELLSSGIDEEKFAELLLKECITLFENAKVNQEDDVDYGLEEAQNIIKEHFGVDNK